MTNTTPPRHQFLDDLTADAELRSTVLRAPVVGREKVRKLVEAVRGLYKSQRPVFFESIGSRDLLQYEAELGGGLILHGTAIIERNPDRSVQRVSVTFSPLGSALSLAGRLGEHFGQELGNGLFL